MRVIGIHGRHDGAVNAVTVAVHDKFPEMQLIALHHKHSILGSFDGLLADQSREYFLIVSGLTSDSDADWIREHGGLVVAIKSRFAIEGVATYTPSPEIAIKKGDYVLLTDGDKSILGAKVDSMLEYAQAYTGRPKYI